MFSTWVLFCLSCATACCGVAKARLMLMMPMLRAAVSADFFIDVFLSQ